MAQHIIVVEHNPDWEQMFEAEAKLIQNILGNNCIDIHHIGSTSVSGLASKPIIDIMSVVKDIEKVDKFINELEEIGYEYLGEFGIPGRCYLRKGGDERTHQVHIFEHNNVKDIERHLAVRDYLRSNREAVEQYEELKKYLAMQYPYDIEGYCNGKDAFVKSLEQKALEWKTEI